jgi:putative flippase GtrA
VSGRLVTQFTKFMAVGAVGTASHYATLIAFVQLFDVRPVLAAAAGCTVGALVNYALNYRVTFRSTRRHRESAPRFFAVAGLGLLINTAIMGFATKTIGLNYLWSQIIATGIILLINFVLSRHWAFGNARSAVSEKCPQHQ